MSRGSQLLLRPILCSCSNYLVCSRNVDNGELIEHSTIAPPSELDTRSGCSHHLIGLRPPGCPSVCHMGFLVIHVKIGELPSCHCSTRGVESGDNRLA